MGLENTALASGLYLVLAFRPQTKEDDPITFHWALVVVDPVKTPEPVRFHAAQRPSWKFERLGWRVTVSRSAVVALKIGKHIDPDQLEELLDDKKIPMSTPAEEGDVPFSCRVWVKQAVRVLTKHGLITCLDVNALEEEAREKALKHVESVQTGANGATYVSAYSK